MDWRQEECLSHNYRLLSLNAVKSVAQTLDTFVFSQIPPEFQPKERVPYLAHALKQMYFARTYISVDDNLRHSCTYKAQHLPQETCLKKQNPM